MHSRHCCPHTHGPQSHLPNAGLSPYSRLTSSRLLSNMSKGLVNLAASAEAGPSPAQPASPAVRAAPPSGCWAPPHACLGVLAGQRASPPTPLACVWAFLPFATLVSLLRQQQKSLHRVAVSRPPVLYSALIPGFPGDSVVALTPLPPLLWGPAPLHPGRAHLPATPSHTSGGSLPPSGPRCQAPALPVPVRQGGRAKVLGLPRSWRHPHCPVPGSCGSRLCVPTRFRQDATQKPLCGHCSLRRAAGGPGRAPGPGGEVAASSLSVLPIGGTDVPGPRSHPGQH